MENNSRLFLSSHNSHSSTNRVTSKHICCHIHYIICKSSGLCKYYPFHCYICNTFHFFHRSYNFNCTSCRTNSLYNISDYWNKPYNTKTKTNKGLRGTYFASIDISTCGKLFSCHTNIIYSGNNVSSWNHTNKSHSGINGIQSCGLHISCCNLIANCTHCTSYSNIF